MNGSQDMQQMPRYRCHKEVFALKLTDVERIVGGSGILTPAEEGYARFCVTAEYMAKHDPQPGGYYVVYDDGYASWSPAAAFEQGYTRI